MKNTPIYIAIIVSVLLNACADGPLPEVVDETNQIKSSLTGEWQPVEQRVYYYLESYKPGKDTTVVFNENLLMSNDPQSEYYGGKYKLKIVVAQLVNGVANTINLKFEENQNYIFGEDQLNGARWHVIKVDGENVINFMKKESATSDVMQVERVPYTIISLSSDELIVGTKSDAQESVFTGAFNITTGDPVSANRWCTHTIVYKRIK